MLRSPPPPKKGMFVYIQRKMCFQYHVKMMNNISRSIPAITATPDKGYEYVGLSEQRVQENLSADILSEFCQYVSHCFHASVYV